MIEPAPTRDHTERLLVRGGAPLQREGDAAAGFQTSVGNADELELDEIDGPRRPLLGGLPDHRRGARRGSRLVLEDVGVNWTRAGFLRILERMGAIVLGEVEPIGSCGPAEPVCRPRCLPRPIEGTVVEPDEVPLAIDELPLVALLGCFAEGETVVRGAEELRVKESDRIATVVEGLRGLGRRDRGDRGRLRGARHRRPARRALDAHGDHRLALLGAVAGLASHEGVEVVGMEAAAVSYPGFAADLAGVAVMTVVAIDGPAGAGKSTVARAVAEALGFTYLDSGAMYRSVALAAAERGVPPAQLADSIRIELAGNTIRARRPRAARRRDVTSSDPRPGGLGGGVAGGGRSGRPQGDGRRAAPAARARRLGRRGARHRHGRRARRRAEGVPHRRPARARPQPRGRARRRRRDGARPSRRSATSATAPASTRRSSRRPERSCSTPPV